LSKQRSVDTCFWDDRYITQLDPSEKLLFLYLLTNTLTNICGIYQIEMRRIAFDTGFDIDTVQRMLGRLERDGRCIYRDGWIAMRNWIKHQKIQAPGVREGIKNQLESVPQGLSNYVTEGQTGLDLVRHTSNLTKSNLTKSNLNLTERKGLTSGAVGPSKRPTAPTQEQRIQEKKKLIRKQARMLGVEEAIKKEKVPDDPF
jgi:hypothetical protein